MERIPQEKYTPEFRAEAVKLVATGLSIPEVGRRLNIPKARS
jgi:transposase-like protein